MQLLIRHKVLSFTSEGSEDSTSEEKNDEDQDDDKGNPTGELVFSLNQEFERNFGASEEEELSMALLHLDNRHAAGLQNALFEGLFVVSWRLKDFALAGVPYHH